MTTDIGCLFILYTDLLSITNEFCIDCISIGHPKTLPRNPKHWMLVSLLRPCWKPSPKQPRSQNVYIAFSLQCTTGKARQDASAISKVLIFQLVYKHLTSRYIPARIKIFIPETRPSCTSEVHTVNISFLWQFSIQTNRTRLAPATSHILIFQLFYRHPTSQHIPTKPNTCLR